MKLRKDRMDGNMKKTLILSFMLATLLGVAGLTGCGKNEAESADGIAISESDAGSAVITTERAKSEASSGNTDESTPESTDSSVSEKADDSSSEASGTYAESDGSTVTIPQKADASEGEWLAAEAVVGVSMSYGDFEIEHIYVGDNEAGIQFKSEGQEIAILVTPLEEERMGESGTRDIYTQDLGYASFDEGADAKTLARMKEVTMEDLDTLIEQSVLVTILEH